MCLLEMLADDKHRSQRDMSSSLNISLGLVNAFIRQLVSKGYCKVKSMPGKRQRYILTSTGMVEKTRLVYEYITISYRHFKSARHRLYQFFRNLENQGATRIVFCGRGELCDIAELALSDTKIDLVAVIDIAVPTEKYPKASSDQFSRLQRNDFDAVLITAPDNHDHTVASIEKAGIPKEKIHFFD